MIIKPRLFRKPRKGHWATKGLKFLMLGNEGSGNKVFDLSGNGNDGIYTGIPDWGAGFYGSQVRCDDDQYITFNNKATDYITDKFTVVWIGTPAQLTADIRRFFVGQYEFAGTNYDWGFYIGSDPYPVQFFVRNITTAVVTSTSISTLVVGKKVCLVGRYDGANISIWFNGVKEDENAQTGNVQGSYAFKLGHTWSPEERNSDVKTDILSIYNRALSAGEIAELYANPFAMFERDPIELWVGATSVGVAPPVDIGGSIAAQAALTGNIISAEKLNSSLTSQSSVTGKIDSTEILQGSLVGQSMAVGKLQWLQGLAGLVEAQSSSAGNILSTEMLAGLIETQSSVAGLLKAIELLTGEIAAQSSLIGYIQLGGITYKVPIITGTPLVTGDILRWDGSNWVNFAGFDLITVDDLPDPAVNGDLIRLSINNQLYLGVE